MSKKYFINNIDTTFGTALLAQLVKQPTEDPIHMGTVKLPIEIKPNGIKKILKREKPKLFRKKAIEECDTYIYNINETQVEDIEFGIDMMLKPFDDTKILILVSDIMVWSNTPRKIKKQQIVNLEGGEEGQEKKIENSEIPLKEEKQPSENGSNKEEPKEEHDEIEEEKQIQYTFLQDKDYQMREPLPQYQYIKKIEQKVLSIKRDNVKVIVVCPGIVYGCGEDNFYELFKAAWLQDPFKLPYLGDGQNLIPTIHLQDLVRFVIKIAQNPPQGTNYLLAFDQTQDKTQRGIISAISRGVGSGLIQSVQKTSLIEVPERYLINLDIRPSKFLVGTLQQPVEFQWISRKGIQNSIKLVLMDFTKKHNLRPIKIIMLQKDQNWRQDSQFDFVLQRFSNYYRIPILNIRGILEEAKQNADEQLIEDLKQEWSEIIKYLQLNQRSNLTETIKVFIRAIKWRLSRNDCTNRGYILQNFPIFKEQLENIFIKLQTKKLKRIKRVKKISKKQIIDINNEGESKEEQNNDIVSPSNENIKNQELVQEQQEVKEQEPDEIQENGPQRQFFYPQSLITIKKMGNYQQNQVADFFTDRGMEELVYDSTSMEQHEIIESLRNYIERNNRPNNYLIDESELLKEHLDFTKNVNSLNEERKQKQIKDWQQKILEVQNKRKKIAEEIFEHVRNEGEEEIKKMPFRNYLMEFVVPTLNEGLLEVSNIIPNDPVDLLAEYLYKNSYDM